MKKKYLLLGLILFFFFVTRLFNITKIPASLYWDEASIGYNAFSVIKDGNDEWGNFLPLHFRAFGEFKLPIYIYSVALSEKFFGLGVFSIRFPSVIYSAFSLILIFLVTKKLFGTNAGLFSAFVFTVSPWNFIFSRTGYEVSAGLFFFLLAVFFFLISEKKNVFFLLSLVSFVLSFYSYNSFRIIIPIFLIIFGLIFLFKNKTIRWKNILIVFISAAFFLVSLIPVYKLYKFDMGSVRMAQVQASGTVEVIKNYFSHFSYNFLFDSGDSNPRSNVPGFGELYLIALPFLVIGCYTLIKKKAKYWWLPFLAVAVGAIPAAITKESPHALRSILMFPFLAIIIGVGLDCFAGFFKKNKEIVIFGTVLLMLLSFENYFGNFLNDYSMKYGTDWQYGYRAIFEYYSAGFNNYEKVVISDQDAQPYIFALTYIKYDPQDFRKTVVYNPVDKWGASTVRSFDKFVFKRIEDTDLAENTLVFATNNDKISGATPMGEIKNYDGTTAFFIYTK